MNIVKYKKLNSGKYQVILDNNEKIILYENVILDNNLLLTKKIDNIENLLKENDKYTIIDQGIKYVSIKVRSVKEIKDYLLKKGYHIDDILNVITKLKEKKYLNDDYYTKCFINDKINLSLDGPKKIEKYLLNNLIDEKVISKYLVEFTEKMQRDKINKYINKMIKSNKNSLYVFKNKLLINLINLGYEKEIIDDCINGIKIDNEISLKEKERIKLRNKLSRKYSGNELERKINEKLYQKGFYF